MKSNNDYSEEFAALKQVYDNYIQAKVKIQSSNQFKTRLFQSLPFALPGVVGVVIGFLGKGSPELFGLSLFITICAPTVGIYLGAKQSAKIPQLLQDLTNQFKIDYVCPKCGTFLGEIPWESLRNRKQINKRSAFPPRPHTADLPPVPLNKRSQNLPANPYQTPRSTKSGEQS